MTYYEGPEANLGESCPDCGRMIPASFFEWTARVGMEREYYTNLHGVAFWCRTCLMCFDPGEGQ